MDFMKLTSLAANSTQHAPTRPLAHPHKHTHPKHTKHNNGYQTTQIQGKRTTGNKQHTSAKKGEVEGSRGLGVLGSCRRAERERERKGRERREREGRRERERERQRESEREKDVEREREREQVAARCWL